MNARQRARQRAGKELARATGRVWQTGRDARLAKLDARQADVARRTARLARQGILHRAKWFGPWIDLADRILTRLSPGYRLPDVSSIVTRDESSERRAATVTRVKLRETHRTVRLFETPAPASATFTLRDI